MIELGSPKTFRRLPGSPLACPAGMETTTDKSLVNPMAKAVAPLVA